MSDSLKTFKTNLADGKYETRTGARRAIGKFREMSEAERDQARALTDKHFGSAAEAAPKKPKASAAPKGRKKKAKGAKKSTDPKKAANKAPAKKTPPRKSAESKKSKTESKPSKRSATPRKSSSVKTDLDAAHNVLNTMDTAIASAKSIKDIDGTVDVSNILNLATEGIVAAQRSAMSVVGLVDPPESTVEAFTPVVRAEQEPSTSSPSNGVSKGVTMPGATGVLPGMQQSQSS